MRLQAAEITYTFYGLIGERFRQEVLQVPGLKQSTLESLFRRMDALDAEKGVGGQNQGEAPGASRGSSPGAKARLKRPSDGAKQPKKPAAVRKSLEQVTEAEEFRETTPQGTRLKKAKK